MQACCFPSILLEKKKTNHRHNSADTQSESKHVRGVEGAPGGAAAYLEEPGRDGAPGHPVIRGNVSKHGTWGSSCALRGTKPGQTWSVMTKAHQKCHLSCHITLSQSALYLWGPEHLSPWRNGWRMLAAGGAPASVTHPRRRWPHRTWR